MDTTNVEACRQPVVRPLMVLCRVVLGLGVLIGLLFGGAGRFNLPFFWAVLGLMIVVALIATRTIDRGLLRERMKPAPGGIDRHIRAMIMPFSLAHLALAGLDARFGWSHVPFAAQLSGLTVMALCFALSIWAMRVNHFFSPVVRIQSERGHRLVTGGPYAYIRHPGYLSAVMLMASSGVALGSWWSLLPNIGAVLVIFRRLLLEDRFLHENLDGYRDYAQRVRSRLVPAVW